MNMNWKDIASKVRNGDRIDSKEALSLFQCPDLPLLGSLADWVRTRKNDPKTVTYIIDRNINYTNFCVTDCDFCAFYVRPGSKKGYVLSCEELDKKIEETLELGGRQILLQGGHNPSLKIDFYEKMFRHIKEKYPIWIHGLSASEVVFISKVSKLSVEETLKRLIRSGLDSLPGAGAEILVERVRKIINPKKVTTDEWLDVMRLTHRFGLRSTATMMFGHVETLEDRVEHLERLRELQDETHGFTAFITWTFQPDHTPMGGEKTSTVDYLRTLAIARIYLDNFDHLQASWVTQGPKIGQVSLKYGVDDFGSVMIEENVVKAAGTVFCMSEPEMVRLIEMAGYKAVRRNMKYEVLGEPYFRIQKDSESSAVPLAV
ncbi:MAG: dehypoxanthine futalosine cyclase [Chlamydiae bacterium]|nr:dehypoxanthine futalosine cyclase [Chlamydiota bacterium]MBI3265832.1 dehypoxanthine futalosine cyclase [Chlamydiota bacterium]